MEIEASDGAVGFAVTTGGEPAAYIVEKHLARFIEGAASTDIEKIWDQMYQSTLYYGRKGLVINTLSGVDLALWDLLGEIRQEPVHQLLGGAVRDELQFYATGARPDLAQKMGFIGGESAPAPRPQRRRRRPAQNLEQLADMRERVSPDFSADARLLDQPGPQLRDQTRHRVPMNTGSNGCKKP